MIGIPPAQARRLQGTRIDAATAAGVVQTLSRTPDGAAQIPWIAHRARLGDGSAADHDRQPAPGLGAATGDVLVDRLQRAVGAAETRADCRSKSGDVPCRANRDRRASHRNGLLGLYPRRPARLVGRARPSDKPVLLVVGGADPQDPLANVADAARELPNSRTVVIPGAGHASVQLGCMPALAQLFIEQGSAAGLDMRCASRYEPPPFVVVRE